MAAEEITSDAITADYRILQRRRGHRYSLDDLAVAWEASQVRPRAMQYVDLGCGIGSVLLMVAWKLADAQTFGVEALQLSADLATRSLALNGIETRASIIVGDLREVARKWPHGSCELVTGTPPYLPKGTALESPDPQRAAARIELRGGVEDYLAAAALLLSPDGRVVVCGDGRKPERVLDGAAACGLTALRRRDVFARAGADGPLLSIWVLARATGVDGAAFEHLSLLIRGDDGEQTSEARQLRASFGL
jgi:tRNA1Val (adenine37-N6)-methyltransferase